MRDSEWWAWYRVYMQSPKWKAKRKKVLDVYRGKCAYCGKPANQVHHLSYERVGKERMPKRIGPFIVSVGDLIALCFKCHNKEHNGRLTYGRQKQKRWWQ